MRAVVVAHGDVAAEDRDLVVGAETVVAAALGKRGAKVIPHPVAKDESDLELALRHAVESGADDIVLLGVFGGARIDHSLANALLLADPAYRGLGVRAVQ